MSEDEREAAKAERRDVIESNKAWDSAETVRREWVRQFATRKTAPKVTSAFLATTLATNPSDLQDLGGNHLAADWLGTENASYGRSHGITALIEKATEARAQMIALALTLAAYEAQTSRQSWRRVEPEHGPLPSLPHRERLRPERRRGASVRHQQEEGQVGAGRARGCVRP